VKEANREAEVQEVEEVAQETTKEEKKNNEYIYI